jgi:hypothetical protein
MPLVPNVISNAMSSVFGKTAPASVEAAPISATPAVDPNVKVVPKAPVSPMDPFADLWKTKVVDPANAPKGMFDGVTQETLRTSAKARDFRNVLTPELLAKVQAGGAGATEALLESMNAMVQTVYADSTHANMQILEHALKRNKDEMFSELPSRVKKINVNETLKVKNPALSHPAVAPWIEAVQAQLTTQYPNESAANIADMAQQYVASSLEALVPKTAAVPTPNSRRGAEVEDWDEWAGS